MNAECRMQNAELRKRTWPRSRSQFLILHSAFCILLLSCKTVGVSTTAGGYAEVSPTIANEMILDSRQVVILDVRSAASYRGAEGHIAGALSAPFDTIERQLPELLPYQNQTVLVYGDGDADGALASKLLQLAGFRNVVHIAGGIQAWIERGYRTVNAQ
jgi:rhodanese-related sulfurtransferase